MGRGESEAALIIADQRAARSVQPSEEAEALAQLILKKNWARHLYLEYSPEEEVLRYGSSHLRSIRSFGDLADDPLVTALTAHTESRWKELAGDHQRRVREVYALSSVLSSVSPDASEWDISSYGAYADGRVDKALATSDNSWVRRMREFSLLTDSETVTSALRLRYGNLHPKLAGREWGLKRVLVSEIEIGDWEIDSARVRRMAAARLPSGLSRDPLELDPRDLPQGVTLSERGRYRILEGRHALNAAIRLDSESISLWVSEVD